MGGCSSATLKVPHEKKFRRAIKLYEVKEVESMTNLLNRNRCFDSGESPLTLAAQEGHEAVVEALIDGGADVNRLDRNGKCPLHIATQFNDVETVEILLNHKANPNRLDGNQQTALHIACQKGFHKLTKLLLQSGACPNDACGIGPLVYAVLNGHGECVDLLLQKGGDPNTCDARGRTALQIAVGANDVLCTRLLLEAGADPAAPSRDGEALISLACLNACPGILRHLLNAGCDVASEQAEVPALIAAVARSQPECVDMLLEAGAEVDVHDKKGHSALHIAVMSVIDLDKDLYFAKYFSNVYRLYAKYDPMELNHENATKCAMSLVQCGADVSQVWEKFSLLFPNPDGISFEQMVLCEVLIQAFGFASLSYKKIRIFVSNIISIREHGLIKLLFSAGAHPAWEDQSLLAMSTDPLDKDLYRWIKGLRTSPRQLRDLCRQQIRKQLSWNVLYNVEHLVISSDLKEYLCIMNTEYYSNADML